MTVTSITGSSTGVTFTADDDELFILPNGYIVSTGDGVSGSFSSRIRVLGTIAASGWGIGVGTTGKSTELFIGKTGVVMGDGIGFAIYGRHSIINYGQIVGSGVNSYGADTIGAGTFINYGSIAATGSGGRARVQHGSGGETSTTINYGDISGDISYDAQGTSALDRVFNYGTMVGDVLLGNAAGSLLDSTKGSVAGTVTCGFGGDTVVAGVTGGSVVGGSGADLLYGNPTSAAAANFAKTTLDGKGGNNALYGSSGFTTFVAGTAAGGTNQIWGKASQMAGVTGYTNNTISFATSSKGVYVDLKTGHNAFVSTTTNWAGPGVFEDWIAAAGVNLSSVPNVIGSAGRDVIICDNGVDAITGGGGSDSLYAGTGPDKFVYNAYSDSNTVNGYDTIVGFKLGTDQIDVSSFMSATGLGPSAIQIFTNGTSNTVYVEQTAGTFNPGTDLALIVNTSAAGGLNAARDFIF